MVTWVRRKVLTSHGWSNNHIRQINPRLNAQLNIVTDNYRNSLDIRANTSLAKREYEFEKLKWRSKAGGKGTSPEGERIEKR